MEKKKQKKGKKIIVFVLVALLVVVFVRCSGSSSTTTTSKQNTRREYVSWPTSGLGSLLPDPGTDKILIDLDTDEQFNASVEDAAPDLYDTYIALCSEAGFTVESKKTSFSYEAFNETGYKLLIMSYSDSLQINLNSPISMGELKWPISDVAGMLPVPNSAIGKVSWDRSNGFYLYVGNMDLAAFDEYIDACAEAGFTVDYQRGETYYRAYNDAGYYISLTYEGFSVISIHAEEPEQTDVPAPETVAPAAQQDENPETVYEPAGELPAYEATEAPSDQTTDSGLIRAEVKEAIDSYEAFVDEYCAFLESYDSSDWTMLAQYTALIARQYDMAQKFDNIENQDLTDAESWYYAEVSLRCSQKMLSVAGKVQ